MLERSYVSCFYKYPYIIPVTHELILCMQMFNPFEIYLGILWEIKGNLFPRIFSKPPAAYSAFTLGHTSQTPQTYRLLFSSFKYLLAHYMQLLPPQAALDKTRGLIWSPRLPLACIRPPRGPKTSWSLPVLSRADARLPSSPACTRWAPPRP